MEQTFSMAETAERFGLTSSTLRYYDKEGLLPGVVRTEGGTRRFTQETLRALHIIACLKVSGLSIQQIRRFFALAEAGPETASERHKLFEEQREAVRHQMQELQATLDVLDYKCWFYETADRLGSEKAVFKLPPEDVPPRMRSIGTRIEQLPRAPETGEDAPNQC